MSTKGGTGSLMKLLKSSDGISLFLASKSMVSILNSLLTFLHAHLRIEVRYSASLLLNNTSLLILIATNHSLTIPTWKPLLAPTSSNRSSYCNYFKLKVISTIAAPATAIAASAAATGTATTVV